MIKKEKISELCEAALSDSQFVVDIKINNANDIFVYIDDFDGLKIEECKRISRFIESNLDREVEDYSLEVGSPGLSKAFKVENQYKKAINTEVEVILNDGEKIIGKLCSVNDENIIVAELKKVKVNNKKQEIEENHIINKNDIKSTKSIVTFSKKTK